MRLVCEAVPLDTGRRSGAVLDIARSGGRAGPKESSSSSSSSSLCPEGTGAGPPARAGKRFAGIWGPMDAEGAEGAFGIGPLSSSRSGVVERF